MKTRSIKFLILLAALGLVVGCSNETDPTAPGTETANHNPHLSKDGSEILGPPSITIASGSGFAEGGVGMAGRGARRIGHRRSRGRPGRPGPALLGGRFQQR